MPVEINWFVDNDNSDVIVKLEKFSKGEDLQDALQCNVMMN